MQCQACAFCEHPNPAATRFCNEGGALQPDAGGVADADRALARTRQLIAQASTDAANDHDVLHPQRMPRGEHLRMNRGSRRLAPTFLLALLAILAAGALLYLARLAGEELFDYDFKGAPSFQFLLRSGRVQPDAVASSAAAATRSKTPTRLYELPPPTAVSKYPTIQPLIP